MEKKLYRNKYKILGITLIELLVVIAIVSILAAITLPTFTAYMAKSKVNEALQVLEEYKVRTIKINAITGTTPTTTAILYPDGDTANQIDSNNKTVTGLNYVDRVSAFVIGSSVLLGARLKTSGVITAANNYIYIAYVNNQWVCGASATKTNNVPATIIPKSCNKILP